MVSVTFQAIAEYIGGEGRLPSPEVIVERTAARRLFLLRSLVVDPGDHARGKAAFDRVMQLGGNRAKAMVFATAGRALVRSPPSDKQFRDLQLDVTRRYIEAKAPYERQERVERESTELLGAAMLEQFLESNPRASTAAQLLYMEEAVRRLRAQDLAAIS